MWNESETNVTSADRSLMTTLGPAIASIYKCLMCIGLLTNFYVLYRTYRLAREDPDQYKNGTGICLTVMALADLSIISATIAYACLNWFESATLVKDVICPMSMFVTHAASTTSIWCWVLMSALRYCAVYFPIQYRKLWHIPYYCLIAVSVSCLANAWLLWTVRGGRHAGCNQQSDARAQILLYKTMHLVDVSVSFLLPTLIIVYVDIAIVLFSPSTRPETVLSPVSAQPKGPSNDSARSKGHLLLVHSSSSLHIHHSRIFFRCVIISLCSVFLNTPQNLIRLSGILGLSGFDQYFVQRNPLIGLIAELLYFFQFSFNAIYLTLFVYQRSVRTISSSTGRRRKRTMSEYRYYPTNSHKLSSSNQKSSTVDSPKLSGSGYRKRCSTWSPAVASSRSDIPSGVSADFRMPFQQTLCPQFFLPSKNSVVELTLYTV